MHDLNNLEKGARFQGKNVGSPKELAEYHPARLEPIAQFRGGIIG